MSTFLNRRRNGQLLEIRCWDTSKHLWNLVSQKRLEIFDKNQNQLKKNFLLKTSIFSQINFSKVMEK